MKKITFTFKTRAKVSYAMRFAFVIGFLVFTVSIGKAQVDKTYVTNNPSKTSAAGNIQPVSQVPAQITTQDVITEKMGEHAPDINDADYRNKLEKWIQNYPEEFEAYLLKSEKSDRGMNSCKYPELKNPTTPIQQKVAEHAPLKSDPDYEAKTNEWMKNYPEEYNEIMQNSSVSNTNQNIETGVKVIRPALDLQQKIAEHAPDMSDPDYDAKKIEWMKNYPEEYNVCLEKSTKPNTDQNAVLTTPIQNTSVKVVEQAPSLNNTNLNTQNDDRMKNYPEEVTTKPFTGLYSSTTKVAPKPAIKAAEHAPYMNDPDYEAKKAEWIKNYPQEYEQSLNSSLPQNK